MDIRQCWHPNSVGTIVHEAAYLRNPNVADIDQLLVPNSRSHQVVLAQADGHFCFVLLGLGCPALYSLESLGLLAVCMTFVAGLIFSSSTMSSRIGHLVEGATISIHAVVLSCFVLCSIEALTKQASTHTRACSHACSHTCAHAVAALSWQAAQVTVKHEQHPHQKNCRPLIERRHALTHTTAYAHVLCTRTHKHAHA